MYNGDSTGEQTQHTVPAVEEALPIESNQAPNEIQSLSEGTNNQENDNKRLRKTEKFDDVKTQSSIVHTPSKTIALRSLDSRLPAVKSSSVFDRLYKSHTVASRSHTLSSRARLKPSTRAKLPNRNTSEMSLDVEKDLLNFNRMTISRSKRVSTPHKIQLEHNGGNVFSYPSFSTPQQSRRKKRLSTYDQAPHTAPSKSSASSTFSVTPRSSKRVYEFSPRMKPLTKLYFVSKFHPGIGNEPIEPISLGYTFFQTFCEYETGGIDAEHIAKEIFIAFFKKDHSMGLRHWKLNDPVVGKIIKSTKSRQGRRGGTAYPLTMSATYAWGNIYRVAHAKGVVRFRGSQNREIMVENFTYNLTGDP
jgi:hypothetical protein